MQVIESIPALRQVRRSLKGTVGLVPTMGALHRGHLALVEYARDENDSVIATIFVNPTQFAPDEDLDAYPRDLDGDLQKFESAGVDVVFTPGLDLMYPAGFQTYVTVEEITRRLEGQYRPGHFRGVATVVAKLFNLTQPTIAYFGQKDAQQVAVIRRMAMDLNFPLEIGVVPIIREDDGLAMSSRNKYLTPVQRQAAVVLSQALTQAGAAYADGERHPEKLREIMQHVLAQELLAEPDYVSVASPHTLVEASEPGNTPLLLSMAVTIGKARLLDNCLLPLALNTREEASKVLGASVDSR